MAVIVMSDNARTWDEYAQIYTKKHQKTYILAKVDKTTPFRFIGAL